MISVAAGNLKELSLNDSITKENKLRDPKIDFSVVINYVNGSKVSTSLSSQKLLNPGLKIQYGKLKSLSGGWGNEWEPVFENYYFPIQDNDSITSLKFEFDRTPFGVIQIDHISLQN